MAILSCKLGPYVIFPLFTAVGLADASEYKPRAIVPSPEALELPPKAIAPVPFTCVLSPPVIVAPWYVTYP